MSQNELLDAVRQLGTPDLQHFVSEVLDIRASRQAPCVSTEEGDLLQRINAGLPEELQRRFRELIDKRRAETLGADEHAELLRLTEAVERLEADRMAALLKLAQIRRVSLPALMEQLGIQARANG